MGCLPLESCLQKISLLMRIWKDLVFLFFFQRWDLKGVGEKPIGIRVHLTGDEEMRVERERNRGGMRNVGSLRHMLMEMMWFWQIGIEESIYREGGKEGKGEGRRGVGTWGAWSVSWLRSGGPERTAVSNAVVGPSPSRKALVEID